MKKNYIQIISLYLHSNPLSCPSEKKSVWSSLLTWQIDQTRKLFTQHGLPFPTRVQTSFPIPSAFSYTYSLPLSLSLSLAFAQLYHSIKTNCVINDYVITNITWYPIFIITIHFLCTQQRNQLFTQVTVIIALKKMFVFF